MNIHQTILRNEKMWQRPISHQGYIIRKAHQAAVNVEIETIDVKSHVFICSTIERAEKKIKGGYILT